MRIPYHEYLVEGDSGNPVFLLAGDQVVMIAEFQQKGYSPFMGFYVHEIQTAMDQLCPGYQLTLFDLSGYSQVIKERIQR